MKYAIEITNGKFLGPGRKMVNELRHALLFSDKYDAFLECAPFLELGIDPAILHITLALDDAEMASEISSIILEQKEPNSDVTTMGGPKVSEELNVNGAGGTLIQAIHSNVKKNGSTPP